MAKISYSYDKESDVLTLQYGEHRIVLQNDNKLFVNGKPITSPNDAGLGRADSQYNMPAIPFEQSPEYQRLLRAMQELKVKAEIGVITQRDMENVGDQFAQYLSPKVVTERCKSPIEDYRSYPYGNVDMGSSLEPAICRAPRSRDDNNQIDIR